MRHVLIRGVAGPSAILEMTNQTHGIWPLNDLNTLCASLQCRPETTSVMAFVDGQLSSWPKTVADVPSLHKVFLLFQEVIASACPFTTQPHQPGPSLYYFHI